MICLPLSKSSWPEGRFGAEKYQDYFTIVKKSIDLLKEKKIDKILLLSNFKSKQGKKSELENMVNICILNHINENELIIEKNGYDTLSQLKFTFNLCKDRNQELIIISSLTHFPRVVWICWRLNKKYNIKYKNIISLGIPRIHDVIYDLVLMFIYPILDLWGFSENFSRTIKRRRNSGIL